MLPFTKSNALSNARRTGDVRVIWIGVFAAVAAALAIGFLFGMRVGPVTIVTETREVLPAISGERMVAAILPAVDEDGRGVVANLTTRVRPGSGLVLVSINDVIAGFETQLSARTATKVAANYTGVNISTLDVIYQVKANASVIEGPSAGAAMTLSAMAALQNKTLRSDVTITGTINEDGTIGRVGGISQKANASKEAGAMLFLVPKGQGYEILTYEKQRTCRMYDGFEFCTIEYAPRNVSVGQQLGITVVEVANVTEAARYAIGG